MGAKFILVLGSAPDVLLPPRTMKFAEVYCANGALAIADEAGYPQISTTLFTHAGFANGHVNAEREHMFTRWQDRCVGTIVVDETDGTAESLEPLLARLNVTYAVMNPMPYDERGKLTERVLGKNLGQGTDQTRVSTGVFAICAALDDGAEHVVIAGIGLGNGHHGSSANDQRKHLLGDVEALRILAKRGKCSTTSPSLAQQFGFPLLVAPGNEQRVAYQQSHATAREAVACFHAVVNLLADSLQPPPDGHGNFVADFGSGAGHVVDAAVDAGFLAVGFDLYPPAPGTRGAFMTRDVGQPWGVFWGKPDHRADIVICWETAEHLPPEGADHLCRNLRESMRPGGFLVFTAATPGQGGSGHLNEQPHDYWVSKLAALRLHYLPHLTARLRSDFVRAAPNAWWYGRNVLVLQAPK